MAYAKLSDARGEHDLSKGALEMITDLMALAVSQQERIDLLEQKLEAKIFHDQSKHKKP